MVTKEPIIAPILTSNSDLAVDEKLGVVVSVSFRPHLCKTTTRTQVTAAASCSYVSDSWVKDN